MYRDDIALEQQIKCSERTKKNDSDHWSRTLFVGSLAVFIMLFSILPELDLAISRVFFDFSTGSFPANDNLIVQVIYWAFKELPNVILPMLIGLSVLACFKKAPVWIKINQRKWWFMLVFLIIGPGLIVHPGFKDNWGRARPRDVTEFNGVKHFTPALVMANQCEKNCSFVSGHAAMGFAFMALGWAFGRRRWLVFGIGLGALVGGIRVMQGGHFASDVVFCGYICYASAWLTARLILK